MTSQPTPPLVPGPPGAALHRLLDRWAQEQPQQVAVVTPHAVRTYDQLAQDSRGVARALHLTGVGEGERVAVLSRNGLAHVQLLYGSSRAGVAVVCLNWRLTAREIAVLLADCTPRLVFCAPEFADLLPEGTPAVPVTEDGLGAWSAGVGPADDPGGADPAAAPVADLPDRTAVLVHTTGTTGAPKGVQLSHRNLWFMAEQAAGAWAMHRGMRFLACLPFFHVSGLSVVVCSIATGARVVVPASASAEDICRTVQEQGITHTVLVPTVLATLADDPEQGGRLAGLEVVVYGSAPAGSDLVQRCMAMLPQARFSQGYGLTETAAGVTAAPLLRHGDPDPHPGSAGALLPHVECRIVDPDSGDVLGTDQVGEVWVRTPTLTTGYLNRPDDTRAAISTEGWFRTGDLGELDADGFLTIRDRLKDMIISGGENIYSTEVENAVSTHPAVREAAVIGVPDQHWGQTVAAVVTLHPGATLALGELTDWLGGRLARYKHPRRLQVVETMPVTGSGKILKRALHDLPRADA